jgi:hypothetical protein
MLNLTPPHTLTDGLGRPYFLWDCDLTLADFRARLQDENPDVRAYFLAKAMRQARPDDVFQFVTVEQIRESWTRVARHLGQTRPFWTWLLDTWERQRDGVRQP